MPSDAPCLHTPYFTEQERRDLEAVPHNDWKDIRSSKNYSFYLLIKNSDEGTPSVQLDWIPM